MKNKRILLMTVFVLVAGIAISACAATPKNDTASATIAEQPQTEAALEDNTPVIDIGDCYNAFNPVEEGKVWHYRSTAGSEISDLETSYKNTTKTSFTTVQKFPDFSTESQWTCGPDGLISDQLVNINLSQIPGVSIETVKVEGVVFPREDLWQAGYSWDTNYEAKVKIANGETVLEGNGNMIFNNTITGVESVSVPSGVYDDALRVDVTGTIKVGVMGFENTIPITYTNWFVKGTGLVKSASIDSTFPFSMELISVE